MISRSDKFMVDPDWRDELLEIARGRGVHNQAATASIPITWNNLHFRSKSELRIAEALDRAGVLFFPNCRLRLTTPDGRRNREADFLVCKGGQWGILEVDGEPFHPPTRTLHDHERDLSASGTVVTTLHAFQDRQLSALCYRPLLSPL